MKITPFHVTTLALALMLGLCFTPAAWAQSKDKAPSDIVKGDSNASEKAPAEVTIDEQAVNLRPMFKAGRTTRYSFWSQRDRDVQVQFNGEQQASTVRMIFEGQATWTVKSVRPDGSATCLMTYDHIVSTIQTQDGNQQVSDSRKPTGENEQVHIFLKAMVGVPVEVQVTADGSATSVAGTNAILQRLGEDYKAMAPADEEHIESAMEMATLPGAPPALAVGKSWTAHYDWKHEVGRNKMAQTYQLAQVESIAGIPVATINTSASPVIVPDYSKFPANGPKVTIRQTQGSYQGQIIFDLQRHDTVGYNTVNVIGLDINIALPNNQTIHRQVIEKLQSQLLRVAEVK